MKNSVFTITVEFDGELREQYLKLIRQLCLIEVRQVCHKYDLTPTIKSNVCGD